MTDPSAPPVSRCNLSPRTGAGWGLRLTGSAGGAALLTGLFLLWDPAGWLAPAALGGGLLAVTLPAMPGAILLAGTAALGYALIRWQEG